MTTEAMDPLRSFDLDEDEWQDFVALVRKEGKAEWDDYAPAVAAAVIDGYLDKHLQTLGKFMRERYLYLKNRGEAPIYTPRPAQDDDKYPVRRGWGPRVIAAVESGEYEMLPSQGVHPYSASAYSGRQFFRAKDYTFNKGDFVGKHFVSPVPVTGGGLYRIESIGRDNAKVICVVANREGKEGRTSNFILANQRWYNLPPSS
jgi:hypothetical protein